MDSSTNSLIKRVITHLNSSQSCIRSKKITSGLQNNNVLHAFSSRPFFTYIYFTFFVLNHPLLFEFLTKFSLMIYVLKRKIKYPFDSNQSEKCFKYEWRNIK